MKRIDDATAELTLKSLQECFHFGGRRTRRDKEDANVTGLGRARH